MTSEKLVRIRKQSSVGGARAPLHARYDAGLNRGYRRDRPSHVDIDGRHVTANARRCAVAL